ncbi:MAG TPA: hypothetical protein PKM88_11600, partial [bacterium]|nr:hypothetical protein [bacterium]
AGLLLAKIIYAVAAAIIGVLVMLVLALPVMVLIVAMGLAVVLTKSLALMVLGVAVGLLVALTVLVIGTVLLLPVLVLERCYVLEVNRRLWTAPEWGVFSWHPVSMEVAKCSSCG